VGHFLLKSKTKIINPSTKINFLNNSAKPLDQLDQLGPVQYFDLDRYFLK